MLEADGIIWELNAPYGGHMGAMCTEWEPCVRHMGAVCEPYGNHMGAILRHTGAKIVPTVRQMALSGSCMHLMGAVCAMWELPSPYGSHIEAVRAVWEVDGAIWSQMRHIGAIWEPYGAIWEADGTIWEADGAIWELRAQYGANLGVVSPYGSCVHRMGAMHAIWEPYAVPFGGLMVYGSSNAPCGSHVQPCGSFHAIWKPHDAVVRERLRIPCNCRL
jgi:hypothetical protein